MDQYFTPSLVVVNRDEVLKDGMRSDVFLNLPVFEGHTTMRKECCAIEDVPRHPKAKKVHGETAIPAGTYELSLRVSPKFSAWFYTHNDVDLISRKEWEALPKWQRDTYHQHEVLWVKNVPAYQFILLHWGNTNLDTEGCLVLGKTRGKLGQTTAVLASKDAYILFYKKVAPWVRATLEDKRKSDGTYNFLKDVTRQCITYVDAFHPSKLVGAPKT